MLGCFVASSLSVAFLGNETLENDLPNLLDAVEREPLNWFAHAQLASAFHQLGQHQKALQSIDRAINLQDDQPLLFGLQADIQLSVGDQDAAIKSLSTGIALDPVNVELHSALGLLLLESGQAHNSYTHLQTAADNSHEARHWFNLANAHKVQRNLSEAVDCYRKAIELDNAYVRAYRNLAICLVELNQYELARQHLDDALNADNDHAETWFIMGFVQRLSDDFKSAIESFRRCIVLEPKHEQAREMLGRTLTEIEDIEAARDCFKDWIKMDPGNAIAAHMLAALSGDEKTDRASKEYVAAAFDQFADSFETVLGKLDYQVPQRINEKLEGLRLLENARSIMDAGCGTGLCGSFLSSPNCTLVGVDLSNKMLAHAKVTGCYDQLLCQDLIEYLNENSNKFDLIVAADTFNYFGDLYELFLAVAGALKADGSVVFSLEQSSLMQSHYELNKSGRFKHSLEYINRSLHEASLDVIDCSEETLRIENEQRVDGFVIAAQKKTG